MVTMCYGKGKANSYRSDMENENFNHGVMRIMFNRFYGAGVTEMVDDNGELHRGIFIPFNMNCIGVTEKGEVVATIYVNKRFNNYKCTEWKYFLKLGLDEATMAQYRKLGLTPPRPGFYSETVRQMVDSKTNFSEAMSMGKKL